MGRGIKTGSWLVGVALLADGTGRACGPFFADTVLTEPHAVLDVPPVSYLHELAEFAGIDGPITVPSGVDRLAQVPVEIAELETHWRSQGIDGKTISSRSALYGERRTALLKWTRDDEENADAAMPPELGLGDGFPDDVIRYLEGARLLAAGDRDGARARWEALCGQPAEDTRLRRAWAAWMLASTAKDRPEAVRWYREVIAMVEAGAADSLGLAAGAYGWLSTLDAKDDPVEAIRLTYRAVKGGHHRCITDLRNRCHALLTNPDPAVLAAAARDPEVRQLINLDLFARLDGPHHAPVGTDSPEPLARWLEALGSRIAGPDATRIAWALYSSGRFDEAADWLERADDTDPRTGWLRGKLALRDGRVEDARRELAASAELARKQEESWSPANPLLDRSWHLCGPERRSASQGRLLADLAMVELSRGEYGPALDKLLEGGFREDAAYVAERVLSTDELLAHLRTTAPAWSESASKYWSGIEQRTRWGGTYRYEGPIDPTRYERHRNHGILESTSPGDDLRYLLARGLAREWRFDDAREWMPPPLLPLFDHYVALHRARLSGRHRGEAGAVIAWRQACIHRIWGMELFGTESAPDGHFHRGSFPARDFAAVRAWWGGAEPSAPEGWFVRTGPPVLPVSDDEIRRIRSHRLPEERRRRFHYRVTASEIAWKAAALLPDDHPQLAAIYNSAGLWLADRDPQAADRFYQALVRRCAGTGEGRRADEKRWFLDDLERPGEWHPLPEKLRPQPPPPVAAEG